MDFVVWLRSLGLGKYEAVFRENEIDETILPNLTAEDLKDAKVGLLELAKQLGNVSQAAVEHQLKRVTTNGAAGDQPTASVAPASSPKKLCGSTTSGSRNSLHATRCSRHRNTNGKSLSMPIQRRPEWPRAEVRRGCFATCCINL
jgi:hypothetical protein